MPDDRFIERYGPAAVVTGASSGIGRAFAQLLAARGLDLLLVARRRERLEELASSLTEAHGIRVAVCQADLSEASAPRRISEAAGDLDIGLLISNAGFGFKGAYSTAEPAGLTDMLMVNCNAPLLLARAFIPRLQSRGRGGIMLTSSVEGLIGCPYSAAYAATKSFVNSLGEGLWAELQGDNIDVLTLCPGATDTEAPRLQGIDPSTLTDLMAPEDVARQALDNLGNGPTYIAGDNYRAKFEQMTALPRADALRGMAAAMKHMAGGD